MQAEQQELAERLEQQEVQVFTAVGELQPSSLQIGGGTLYRLVDPATGRTEIYVRTTDTKITAMMGQFIGITGEPTTDPQLSLRLIEPTDAAAGGSVEGEYIGDHGEHCPAELVGTAGFVELKNEFSLR